MRAFSNFPKNLRNMIGGGYSCIVKSAALLILSTLLFTSCENFLDNKDVKDEILDVIAYNNAPECIVLFSTQNSMGSFLVTGRQTLKVGYKLQVQYTVTTSDYIFEGLEAVSTDESESRADCVTFETVRSDEQKGIYAINITLTKQKNDILIKPKCRLIPKIIKLEPALESSGCDQDTEVKITFNKAIDFESFKQSAKINIYSENDSLADYFMEPYPSNDNTIIYIRPNEKRILDPNGDKNSLSIFVNYDFTKVKDCQGLELNQSGTYEYRIRKEYHGQQKVKIYAEAGPGISLGLKVGESADCTVGYKTEINFTMDSSTYVVKACKAVSYADQNTSLDDIIQTTIIPDETNPDKFKASVWVKDNTTNALLIIQTLALPAVDHYLPAYTPAGVTTDKEIKIFFNTPVEVSIKDALKIDILGSSVLHCFEQPELSSDGTVLTIKPDITALTNFIAQIMKVSFADINISFAQTATAKIDGVSYPLKQDSNSKFVVRYLNEPERNSPTPITFFVTREEITLEDSADSVTNKFTQEQLDLSLTTTDTKIIQNASNGTIWIYGVYSDPDSGVKKVTVFEKRTNDINSWTVTDSETKTGEYILDSTNSYTDEIGNTSFCIKHILQPSNPDFEGAVSVKVVVADNCDNKNTQSFTGIIKRKVSLDNILIYNFIRDDIGLYLNNSQPIDVEDYIRNVKKIKFLNDDLPLQLYANVNAPRSFIHLNCRHSGIKQEFENPDENGVWSLELNTASVDYLPFTIIYSDLLNLTVEKSFRYPSSYYPIYDLKKHEDEYYDEEEDDYKTRIIYEFCPAGFTSNTFGIKTTEQGSTVMTQSSAQGYYYPEDSEYDYYFFRHQNYPDESSQLCSELVSFADVLKDYVPVEETEEIQVTYSSEFAGDDTILITVTFTDEDIWENYDTIIYDLNDSNYVKPGEPSFIIPIKLSQIHTLFACLKITAYSHYQLKGESEEIWIRNLGLEEIAQQHDKTPPYLTVEPDEFGGYSFRVNDEISDVGNGVITFGNIPHQIQNSSTRINISYSDIIKYAQESDKAGVIREISIPYTISDTANNTISEVYELLVPKLEREYKCILSQPTTTSISEGIDMSSSSYPSYSIYKGVYLYKLEESEGSLVWNKIKNSTLIIYSDGDIHSADFNQLQTNNFYKTCFEEENSSLPNYYYLGAQNSGDYDGILNNGDSKTSVFVSSDAPVFVHTLVTTRPYSECSTWSIDDWEQYRKEIGTKVMQFAPDEEHTVTVAGGQTFTYTTSDHSPKRYDIPVEELSSGNCYCVIAWFADGTCAKSPVMQY